MTPLSPDRLEELAAVMAAQDELAVEIGETPRHREAVAALRAGAGAWRIATAFAKQAGHLDRCRALALPVGPCTCGLAALEQRLAALGGEGEQ